MRQSLFNILSYLLQKVCIHANFMFIREHAPKMSTKAGAVNWIGYKDHKFCPACGKMLGDK